MLEFCTLETLSCFRIMRGILKSFFCISLLLIHICQKTQSQAIGIRMRDCQSDTCATFCCIRGYCAKYYKKYCVEDTCNCENDCQPGSGLQKVDG